MRTSAALILAVCASGAAAHGLGEGRWAAKNDPVAAQLIEQERRWGTDSCTPSNVVAEFIADDFIGTHPKGFLYKKTDMLPTAKPAPAPSLDRDCKLLSAKVRFYGPDLAVIYGSESAIVKDQGRHESLRKLIWTDTVLKRAGRWQVIAVQDMVAPAK